MSESPREALDKLRAGREGAKKPGEVTFVLDGAPTPVQVVWDALDTKDIRALVDATEEEAEKLGIDREKFKKFKANHEEIRKNLAIAASITKKGESPERMVKRIEELYPGFLNLVKDFGIEIKPRVRTPKSQRPPIPEIPIEATATPVETSSPVPVPEVVGVSEQEIVEALKGRHEVKTVARTVERIIVGPTYLYPETNSLDELNDLSTLTPAGLDQILSAKNGFTTFKRRLNSEMKETLAGIPANIARKNGLYLPAYAKANELKNRIARHLVQGHEHYRDAVRADIEEYLTTLDALRTNIEKLPKEILESLTEKKAANTPATPEVLPMTEVLNRAPEQPEAIPSETPKASPESPEGLRTRLEEALSRVRTAMKDAHQGNPLAVVNIRGTHEFFTAYNSAKALLDGHKNGQLNGDETTALPTVTASIAELERMSFEIANTVASKETTPQTTATKPPEAVAVPPAPKINIVIENAENAATPKTSERTPELAALKEKYDTYKAAKEAYEKAIDAHYGAYRSNTGPFKERLGRGMRKFFGIGPKHDTLAPLYLAMNDARVDFSRSRFEAMDARIKARVAKGGVNAGALATWNEGLKRREIGRTIRRSSEGFIKRQYLALSPTQQSAVDAAMGRTGGETRTDERRTTYAQFAVGALSGALMVWKTKSAVMTGGISLVAGAFGVATGNMVGETVEWWKNRKIEKMKDRFDTESKARGATVDYDSIGDYDETLRNRTRKIIATEESRNTQVKAARGAGAVAGGVIAGTFANEFDLGGKAGDDRIATSPESTPKGDFGIPPGPELRPIPDSMPDGVDGTNVVPHPDGVVEKGGMYQMVKDDNPWDLVEEKHFSEKFDAMTKTERDVVIDSAMDRLRADEALRERIFPGYSGTTFTDMQIGQDVNLKEYEKLIDEQLAKGGHGSETLSPLSDTETKAAALPEIESENPEPGEGVEEEGDIFSNEKPSENIEDRRTPEQAAEQEQAFRNTNVETSVSAADIARERQTLYATLGDTGPKGGFLFSLFGPAHTSAHEFLANQTLADVTKLSTQRPEFVAMVASQNNVDQTALQNWTNYMKQLAPDLANRPSDMTFSAYVDVVAEELARHNKQT